MMVTRHNEELPYFRDTMLGKLLFLNGASTRLWNCLIRAYHREEITGFPADVFYKLDVGIKISGIGKKLKEELRTFR